VAAGLLVATAGFVAEGFWVSSRRGQPVSNRPVMATNNANRRGVAMCILAKKIVWEDESVDCQTEP
jgi:hypothetical protein